MKKFLPTILFLLFWALLIKWVNPTVSFGDSGELITGAYTLGVSHAPGQPLYLLLAHLLSLLPLGEIAFRINLLSALFGCLALLILYLSINRNTPPFLSGAAVLTAFFFVPFLQQCIWSEVYTLALFLLLSGILICRLLLSSPRFFPFLGLLWGLGVAAHFSILLILPVLLIGAIMFAAGRLGRRNFLPTLFSFLLAAMVFIYLPLRAVQHPYLNWGAPYNLGGFSYHLLIKQRGGGLPGGSLAGQTRQLLTLVFVVLRQLNWGRFFLPLLLVYPFLGRKKERVWRVFISLLTVLSLLFFGWFLKFNSLALARLQGPKFFLIFYVLVIYISFRLIFQLTSTWLRLARHKYLYQLLLSFLLFFLIHPQVITNMRQLNKHSQYYYASDYAKNLLQSSSSKTGSIFFSDDSFGFPALYLLAVKGKTPKVMLVHLGNAFTNWGLENLQWNYPGLRLRYLNDLKPPYSIYQIGPKFIRQLIKEKGTVFPIFSPFTITDLPSNYKNHPFNLGYRIAVTAPLSSANFFKTTRGFAKKDFVADRWTVVLHSLYVRLKSDSRLEK